MFRKICFFGWLCIFALTVQAQKTSAKKGAGDSASAQQTSDRESDGLLGPVRRVTVESAKVTVKNGQPTEGTRVLRAVTTYDQRGTRVDAVAYPVEGNTPQGKEQYKYDDKGNIVEMQVRGTDGAVLSREMYKYVFDELGNWKQMTTSIAVFEDGKLGEEPVEVSYRAITYFYTQEVAKFATESPTPTSGVEAAKIAAGADKSPLVAPPVITKRVSEEVLRKAAISLPDAQYPQAAELSRWEGRVTVDVIVDENGSVTHARATSPNSVLNDAAEAAARIAKFSPAALSTETARVIGVLTYEFVLPRASAPANVEAPKNVVSEVKQPETTTDADSSSAISAPVSEPSSTTPTLFKQGVAYLESGNFDAAAETLRQSVDEDPEFATAYVKLGLAYSGLRKYKEAVAVFKMAIQIKPDQVDAEAYYQLGNSYSALGKHDDALKAFKQALYVSRAEAISSEELGSRKVPSALQLHYSIGLTYNMLGKFSDAVKELKQVIAINPELAEAYFGLAVCYIGMGDRKSAEKQQKILATLNPALANKIADALSSQRNTPPGVSEGMLGGSRRRN